MYLFVRWVLYVQSTFEYQGTSLSVNSTCILAVEIYRPKRESVHQFLPDFSAFHVHLTDTSGHLVADCFVKGVISDHLAVKSVLRTHRPIRPQRIITFRRLRSIDAEAFRADPLSLPLINNPAGDFDSLLTHYNTGLVCGQEKHAPLLKKLVGFDRITHGKLRSSVMLEGLRGRWSVGGGQRG